MSDKVILAVDRAVRAVMGKLYPNDPEDEDSWRITRAELEIAAPVIVEAERERIKEGAEKLRGEWKPGHICSESEVGMWNCALDRVAALLTEDES